MADEPSTKRAKILRELAARVAVALSVRALWAVIVELVRGDDL
ncbi:MULTISPECIES: hypothetical protein [Streptomyces]|nr:MULTISPECIES: hypothetical protein [unclassified Streptomyces]MDU0302449.1 hypothetical protein [Streptomyces sp. PAL114]